MKPLLLSLIAAVLLSGAPNADELLQQGRRALAGKAPDLTALVFTGTHRVSSGKDVSAREMTVSLQQPNHILKEETLEGPMGGPGPTVLEGFDGEKAWNDSRTPPGGHMIFRMMGPGGEDVRARRMQEMYARYLLATTLTAPEGFPITFSYAGQAEAPDGTADVIDGKGPDNFAIRIFLDSKSHLPLMLTYQAPEQRVVVTRRMAHDGPPPDMEKLKKEAEAQALADKPAIVEYQMRPSEFRQVNGRMLPHVITWSAKGALAEEIEVKKYTVNPSLAPDIFRKK